MHWSTVLYNAAERFDGGARSFPLASEANFSSKYRYEPPNEDYKKLFFCQATISRSQRDPDARPHSAGWLIPTHDDASVCKPVFIAHSVLSAIWLLRETLANDVLPNGIWDRLVCAAQSLAEDGTVEPPSAQKPSASPLTQRKKRPAPSAPALSPKRARAEAVETPAASPQPSKQLSELEEQPGEQPGERPVEEPRTTTTVTNNNRRAERERIKKHEAALIERSLDLGLVAPDQQAGDDERGAYASISSKDKEVISWLFKQEAVSGNKKKLNFYNAVKTPYLKAREFVAKARALGSSSSQEHAAHFLQVWRKRGTLFSGGVAARYNAPSSQLQRLRAMLVNPSQQSSADRAFCSAWERCNVYNEVMKSVHIEYRWAQALLGKALADKLAQIEHSDKLVSSDKTNRFGKGLRRTEAIDSLLHLVNSNPNPSKKEQDLFRARLARAFKWYRVAEGLGWGVLLVMPDDAIPKTWIEHEIRSWGVDVFIELVRKERPDVCLAAKQFDEWLGPEGIAGGEIKGKKTLSIEVKAPETTCEVEEIKDSEDDSEEEEEEEEADRRVEIAQSQVRFKSAPAASLRQTTLPELFKAI
ncbi:hypothetical protein C7974DRAFT_405302 [Boeremia exigua]|uniref:uncharacterized protein n=1 Tax=Boeremia exigua TaxID=749465 RepID=UPI001E8D4633|nr:uncharacterized protein C7974DRAFT_405302 [Boeremia exigua]KAH6613177.1 hypothetical protein C7974DRAFT_405302 [Boeremia exigua]